MKSFMYINVYSEADRSSAARPSNSFECATQGLELLRTDLMQYTYQRKYFKDGLR
jgi:hypothetical protein